MKDEGVSGLDGAEKPNRKHNWEQETQDINKMLSLYSLVSWFLLVQIVTNIWSQVIKQRFWLNCSEGTV